MSASEIIEQIKALPREERALLVQLVDTMEREQATPVARQVCYASDESAKAAGDAVMEKHAELFRKLAD